MQVPRPQNTLLVIRVLLLSRSKETMYPQLPIFLTLFVILLDRRQEIRTRDGKELVDLKSEAEIVRLR